MHWHKSLKYNTSTKYVFVSKDKYTILEDWTHIQYSKCSLAPSSNTPRLICHWHYNIGCINPTSTLTDNQQLHLIFLRWTITKHSSLPTNHVSIVNKTCTDMIFPKACLIFANVPTMGKHPRIHFSKNRDI